MFKVSQITVAGFFPFILGFSQLTNGYNSKQFVMIQREQTKIHGHDAHSARGAITRSSGELGVTLTQLLFLMKGLYVSYKKVSRKKYVGLASLMVGPTILQANKSDGPAVIVLIFEPCPLGEIWCLCCGHAS